MSRQSKLSEVLNKIDTIQLDEGIFLIIGKNKGTFPYCNALLIIDEDVVLIDAGCGSEVLTPLKDHVDILINSHYHIDLILGNAFFDELWVVEEEAGVTSSFERYKQYAGILGEPVEKEWLAWFRDWFEFSPSSHTRTFKANQTLNFGETTWQAVHTPGHSPGHCCFYEPKKRIMFSSDIDCAVFGPWYGNPNADLNDFIQSIRKIRDFDIRTIATSHTFPMKRGIKEALDNYLNVIFKREEHILSCLKHGMTLDDLEKNNIIYRQDQKRYKTFAWFEKKMLKKHLDRLIAKGKIEKVGPAYKIL